MQEWIISLVLLSMIASLMLAYGLRVLVKGAVHFERVERQGGSAFLSKSFKEMGYWGMQPLGRLSVRWGISANQLSWSSLILGFCAGTLLGFGRFGLASAFAATAMLFDALDGMVARMTGAASPAGEVLDSVLDRYVDFFLLAGLLVHYRVHVGLQVVCLLAILGSFMVSYSTAKAEAMGVRIPPGGMRRPERMVYLLGGSVLSSLTMPFESAFTSGIGATNGTPLGIPMIVALLLVAVVSNVTAILRFRATSVQVR